MTPNMRKLIGNLLLFFFLAICLDIVLGGVLDYMRVHAGCGSIREMEYTARECQDDMLIFGSSRAMRHYNPKILSDSLNLSCFNCGRDGMGVFYHYGRWLIIKRHHLPKVIVYELGYNDYEVEASNMNISRYLAELKPYARYTEVRDFITELEPMEQVKLQSGLYRNNSKLIQLVRGCLVKKKMGKGYEPANGIIHRFFTNSREKEVDFVKVHYLEEFIKSAQENNVKFVFMISPLYNPNAEVGCQEVAELVRKYHVPFFDNSHLILFENKDSLFKDINHLNKEGSTVYSELVAHQLKDVI